MRTIRFVSVLSLAPLFAIACSGSPSDDTGLAAPGEQASPLAVASIRHASGHRIEFFAPANGPTAIAEIGPIGTPRVLDEKTLATKKASEIYMMLAGNAQPPAALLAAESRTDDENRALSEAVAGAPPPDVEAAHGTGPQFYTQGDQTWFFNTYCTAPHTQCVQGFSWANSSQGNHKGRGYYTVGAIGSEASGTQTLQADWWNGKSWQKLSTVTLAANVTGFIWGGNTGAPGCNDSSWYFKSEVLPGAGSPTVSLSDHVYSPGGGNYVEPFACGADLPECGGRCGCSGCMGVPGVPGGSCEFFGCNEIALCPDDSCCNPP
jgi:hypothetical protein